jgi:nucleoside-diphosphate-sugar epimerase
MRVLVTGATGFVAAHLIPRLAADGHEVLALGHDAERIPDDAEPLVVDLTQPFEPGSLPAADAIVHLAQANVPFPDGAQELFAVNAASTLGLLEHARTSGARRFVFTSSASVYGFGDRPFVEDDEPGATDFYSLTKRTAERLVEAYREHVGTTVLRLVAPYGPGQRARLIPALVQRVRDGRPVTLDDGGRPRMSPIFVDDVVEVIVRALGSDGHQLVNVAGDELVSIGDLATLIGSAVGREPVFEQVDGASGDLAVDNARMHDVFDLRSLVTLEDGLSRTVAAG